MNLKDFIDKKQVRKATKDISLAKSLLSNAKSDLKFLERLEIDSISARKIMCNYYDVLRSILEAMASLDGYKVYSHEAFTYYLKEKGENVAAEKFDRFRKIRNGINYYGKDISVKEAKENADHIKKLIDLLIERYLEEIA